MEFSTPRAGRRPRCRPRIPARCEWWTGSAINGDRRLRPGRPHRRRGDRPGPSRRDGSAGGAAAREPGPAGPGPRPPRARAAAPPRRRSALAGSRARPARAAARAGRRSPRGGSPSRGRSPLGRSLSGGPLGDELVEPAPPRGAPPGPRRHAMRDPEEPARDRPAPPDGPARLARTRKTAWKASSASCASWRTPRQTRSTIGPCRITSSSKAASAASSRRETNRSRSCASDIVPTAPRLNSRCNVEAPRHLLPISSVIGLLPVVPDRQECLTRILDLVQQSQTDRNRRPSVDPPPDRPAEDGRRV